MFLSCHHLVKHNVTFSTCVKLVNRNVDPFSGSGRQQSVLLEEFVFLYQPPEDSQQTDQVETLQNNGSALHHSFTTTDESCLHILMVYFSTSFISLPDVGGVQVGSHTKEGAKGQASHDAALCPQTAQSANQIPGTSVEEEQHEDHVRHLSEGPPSPQRWLGVRKRWVWPWSIHQRV